MKAIMLLILVVVIKAVVCVPVLQNTTLADNDTQPIGGNYPSPLNINPEMLQEEEDNWPVTEGDILMAEDRNAVESLWGDPDIAYTIDRSVADRVEEILGAFDMLAEHTCIRLHRRTTEFNYLNFIDGGGCASYVGCRGGEQPIYFGRTCSSGNLCHEIIHALGMHHEHTRADRDSYISVQWQHIRPGKASNFKVKNGDTQSLPYDVDSIMHYGPNYFSSGSDPTILAKGSSTAMGQRSYLSHLDVQRIRKLYHCDDRESKHTPFFWGFFWG